jgi:hypothetical protein
VIRKTRRTTKRRTILAIACALAVTLVAANADADIIDLVSGERIEGKIAHVTDDLIFVETAAGVVLSPRHSVRSIGGAPPAGAPAAPGAPPAAPGAPPAAPPAASVAPPAAPAGTPAVSAGEVVKALKDLQATATKPISQKEYGAQVALSRELVDKYLKTTDRANRPMSDAASDAVALYEFAASVWASRMTNSAPASAAIGRSAVIERCPALQKIVADYPPVTDQETAWRRGVAVEFEVPTILTCASEKVAEAERALKP